MKMGLRLYQAPVESDIQSKPAADKTSAQSRSSIRRSAHYSRNLPRDRRRRIAAVAAATETRSLPVALSYYEALGRRSPPTDAAPTRSSAPNDSNTTSATDNGGPQALRGFASRLGILDDRVVAMFGERWAHLHAESNPTPSRDNVDSGPSLSAMGVDSEFFPRGSRGMAALTEPYALSSLRSTQAPDHPSRRTSSAMRGSRRERLQRMASRRAAARESREHEALIPELPAFDGLGDRNRSLSPEGDHVWDTLLTTLTPDPQPPSNGSSFASASALPSTASQNSGPRSSRTSFTGPDTADDEPPCESACENSDTEGDEEDQLPSFTELPSFMADFLGPRVGPRRGNYADVVRGGTGTREHSLDMGGGIDDMQRIVSNLARRQDIPDEWWAAAGLSRTLSREASSSN